MIAVIAAMDLEVTAITEIMDRVCKHTHSGIDFYEGSIYDKELLVMKSGVGKGNAAMATTILMENYPIDAVINIGTAGGLREEQDILDAVVSERVVQYDMDTSAVDGEEGIGLYFDANQELLERCQQALEHLKVKVHCGLIASGDQFVARNDQLQMILTKFPQSVCVEMEAGAIAQVCTHYHKPFVVMRSLSDVAVKENSHMDFCEYAQKASERSAALCKELFR